MPKCGECKGPVGDEMDIDTKRNSTRSLFRFSETAKAIERVKKGIAFSKNHLKLDPKLLSFLSMDLDLQDPKVAYRYGFELAMFQCGEILAEAQVNDKEKK